MFPSGFSCDEPRARGVCPGLLRPSSREIAQQRAGSGAVGLDRSPDEGLYRGLPNRGWTLSGVLSTPSTTTTECIPSVSTLVCCYTAIILTNWQTFCGLGLLCVPARPYTNSDHQSEALADKV